MLAHGMDALRSFVHVGDPSELKFVRTLTRSYQPEAVFCASDHVAAQLLQSLIHLGVHVPGDLRLVGFDNLPFCSLLSAPVTTMEQPCRDIAITAFYALRDRMIDPTRPARALLITPRLVVRESCGAYLQSAGRRPVTRSV